MQVERLGALRSAKREYYRLGVDERVFLAIMTPLTGGSQAAVWFKEVGGSVWLELVVPEREDLRTIVTHLLEHPGLRMGSEPVSLSA